MQLVVLSVGLLASSAVRGSIRLPRCSLRGRPGVLYDGFLASLVSSSQCLWLVVGWMDGQCSIQVYFNTNSGGVLGGGSLLDVLPTDSIQLPTDSIQSVAIGGVVSDR